MFALRIAAAAVVVLALGWRFLTFSGFTNDHYVFLALAQQVLLGERPVADFVDPGEPLHYLLSAAAWRVWGETLIVDWGVTAAGFAAGAMFTLLTAWRLSLSVAIASLVTILTILSSPRTYSYPKILLYAVGAWAIVALAANRSRRRIVTLGIIVAVSFLFRHDHGIYLGAAALVVTVLVAWREPGPSLATDVRLLVASIALVLLPWMAWVALHNPVAYVRNGLEFSRVEARATLLTEWPVFDLAPDAPLFGVRRPDRPLIQVEWSAGTPDADRSALEQRYQLDYVGNTGIARVYYPRDPSPVILDALGRDPSVSASSGFGRAQRPAWREWVAWLSPFRLAPALQTRGNAIAWLFWLFWTLPFAASALAAWRWRSSRERWRGESAAVLAISVLALGANAGFIRETLSVRLPDAVVPAAILGAWLLGVAWSRPLRPALAAMTLVPLLVTTGAVSNVADLPGQYQRAGLDINLDIGDLRGGIDRASRALFSTHREMAPGRYSSALVPFFAYTDRCTADSDRLITNSLFPELYVMARRGFAAGGLAFMEGHSSTFDQAATVVRLRQQQPPFAVLIAEREAVLRQEFPAVARYLDEEYALLTEWPVEGSGPLRILVNKSKPVTRTDQETGWPCFR